MFAPFGVLLVFGPSFAGQDEFAARFDPAAVIPAPLSPAAASLAGRRLKAGLPVVAVADAIDVAGRAEIVALARCHRVAVTAVRCRMPLRQLTRRGGNAEQLRVDAALSDAQLFSEGFDRVIEADRFKAMVSFDSNLAHVSGAFDVIGDVHGELGALTELLGQLGYREDLSHPTGRMAVFVGDLCDKGPDSAAVLQLVMDAFLAGRCLMVKGNHEDRLVRALRTVLRAGNGDVSLERMIVSDRAGLGGTLRQLRENGWFADGRAAALLRFLDRLPETLVLDGGKLTVVHAALHPQHGDVDDVTRHRWCLYGMPYDPLAADRDAWMDAVVSTIVVRGHVTVRDVSRRGNVFSIDTGAGVGGALSSLSWPSLRVCAATTTVELAAAS